MSPAGTQQGFGGFNGFGAASFYRVPVPGEPVTVTGMRRRPELNGARGEIISSGLDEFGRVTVRVYDGSGPDSRKMKIQPFRLVPSASAPSLGGGDKDDRSSVRSLGSRPGSVLSGAGRSSVNSRMRTP